MDVEELFAGICDRIPDAMVRNKVPGVVLGIVCEGREFMKGFGVTSVRHSLPVDEKTLFQIGSTTKTFTASAVMRLVESGKLALDESVRTYLPDFTMQDPEVTTQLTMRHLLTHTGGWEGDFFPDTGNGDDALARYVKLMAELPQLTPLGSLLSYNNAAFSLAGRVIEAVTGKTYEGALNELVLAPLGLRHSFLFPADAMTHSFAVGHTTIGDRTIVLRPWQVTRACAAAGGIAASMIDQMRYARFHLGDGITEDGTRILTRESISMMHTPGSAAMLDTKMGLAWMTRDIGGLRRVFHGGGTYGQISAFTMTPARKFGLAIATNSVSGGFFNLEVTKGLVAKFLGNDEPEPAEIPMTPSQVAEYSGRYTRTMGGDIEIKAEAGKLMMQPRPKGGFPTSDTPPGPTPPPFRIGLIGKDRVAMVEPSFKDIQGEFPEIPTVRSRGCVGAPGSTPERRRGLSPPARTSRTARSCRRSLSSRLRSSLRRDTRSCRRSCTRCQRRQSASWAIPRVRATRNRLRCPVCTMRIVSRTARRGDRTPPRRLYRMRPRRAPGTPPRR